MKAYVITDVETGETKAVQLEESVFNEGYSLKELDNYIKYLACKDEDVRSA